ncbi:MAG TPA: SulP family inorganic anion transporter [Homoserinimonas sp.]|nr:SulP family inorganic anion transporter [Homoserinimonas sp.]
MRRRLSAQGRFLVGLLPAKADLARARQAPGRDLLAGLTVAIVALPLALAFGAASGLSAQAGITTAVIAGILAAVFGGSNVQISGPTGAMTVVLIPVVHQFGPSGLLQVGLMAGIILIGLSVSRLGRYVRYLPTSLVEGFTAGIAVVIALQQVPNMLGVAAGDQDQVWSVAADAVVRYLAEPDPVPLLIALGVAAMILLGARWKPSVPLSLLAVAVATALAQWLGLDLEVIGHLPGGIPAPDAGFLDPALIAALLPSAFAIAALAALESLLSATVADGMTVGEHHNPDRELLGQGLANLVVPFFGGVPATAAIARTAVNVRSGARSRLASVSHSVILLVFVMLAAPVVGIIPMAALGGVLLAVTIQMVQVGAIRSILGSTRGDAIVLILTFGVTVAIDLVTAVVVGLIVAALLALRSVSRAAYLERVPLDEGGDEGEPLEHDIIAFRFDGPLFFGAAHRFLLELMQVTDVSVVILRMSRVSTIDATGAAMLDDAISRLERRGIVVLLSGIRPRHGRVLTALGALSRLEHSGRVFSETPEAIAYARSIDRGR